MQIKEQWAANEIKIHRIFLSWTANFSVSWVAAKRSVQSGFAFFAFRMWKVSSVISWSKKQAVLHHWTTEMKCEYQTQVVYLCVQRLPRGLEAPGGGLCRYRCCCKAWWGRRMCVSKSPEAATSNEWPWQRSRRRRRGNTGGRKVGSWGVREGVGRGVHRTVWTVWTLWASLGPPTPPNSSSYIIEREG